MAIALCVNHESILSEVKYPVQSYMAKKSWSQDSNSGYLPLESIYFLTAKSSYLLRKLLQVEGAAYAKAQSQGRAWSLQGKRLRILEASVIAAGAMWDRLAYVPAL